MSKQQTKSSMAKYWCGVVSKEHIMRGVAGGFCQVCHGKRAPLARMSIGDGIVFYSPVTKFQGDEKCQKFTAIGKVIGNETYPFQMAPDFIPYRRDIGYLDSAMDAPIRPMLEQLSFTRGKTSWGFPFRRGHFEITEEDFQLITQSMLPDSWESVCSGIAAGKPAGPDLFTRLD
ncbi:EVE domain-containing protein [Verminephrobacter aporrectodeae]|uniref:EVE domain-containing protein n=1 Tax=Verminephrobacter aporrectodeae TaxID=1110389 RepID=UPI001F227DC8|nr:EVE domain-containing protein [Verminephrobacter aporrectodeae]